MTSDAAHADICDRLKHDLNKVKSQMMKITSYASTIASTAVTNENEAQASVKEPGD